MKLCRKTILLLWSVLSLLSPVGAVTSIVDLPLPVLRGQALLSGRPQVISNSEEYSRYISAPFSAASGLLRPAMPRSLRRVAYAQQTRRVRTKTAKRIFRKVASAGIHPGVSLRPTAQVLSSEAGFPSRTRYARAIEKRVAQIHRNANPYTRRMTDEDDEDQEVVDYGKQYATYSAMLAGNRNPWTGELEAAPTVLYGGDYVYGELVYPLDGNISFKDLGTLRGLLDSIGGMYNYYYEIMPKKEVSQVKKDMWDTAYDMGQFYVKIRTFVMLVKNDRQKLFKDLAYLNGKINQLKITEDDMLSFYGVTKRYEKAKVKASPYLGRDLKFNLFFGNVRGLTTDFGTAVKLVMQGCYDLSTLNSFFQNQIDSLLQRSSDNAILNALIKADQVIMLLVRLIEIKNDFATSISGIKNGFKAIEASRNALSGNVTAIENLSAYYVQYDASKGVALWGLCATLLFFVLT